MKIAVTPTGHVGSAVADFLLDFGGDIRVKLLARRPENLKRFIGGGRKWPSAPRTMRTILSRRRETSTPCSGPRLRATAPTTCGRSKIVSAKPRQRRSAPTRSPAWSTCRRSAPTWIRALGRSTACTTWNGCSMKWPPTSRTCGPVSSSKTCSGNWTRSGNGDASRCPFPARGAIPMIAARDIGNVAADRLASRRWSGHCVRELHGPADLSYDTVAGVLSQVLGRKIVYIKCDPEEARKAHARKRPERGSADLMIEMYDAVETGRLRALEPRSNKRPRRPR